jgi:hypothetical protein
MAILSTDPIDWAINQATGDLPPTGNIKYTTGIPAVLQAAYIRLRMFAGEWFANLDAGVRYLERDGVTSAQALLAQKFDKAKACREIRDNLIGSPSRNITPIAGIVELLVCDASYVNATRTMTITWQARTEFGDTPVNQITIGTADLPGVQAV